MRKILIFLSLLLFPYIANCNNAFYITLSNEMARKQDLEIITNNAANTNTIGYEEDSSILSNYDVKENIVKNNSFVHAKSSYKSGEMGGLKQTNNPLDLAILGKDQYFKLITPKGIRYTLAGSIFINSIGVLVNSEGFPFLSLNNDIIEVPIESAKVMVAPDGMVIADNNEVERIAVAYIPDKNALIKEGNSLYRSSMNEIPIEEYTILSGALRASNVNPTRVMGQTMEAQRSFSITNNLLKEINEIEKDGVSRILK